MSILTSIAKPLDRPVVATILGDAGLGKTSLAATFPKPVFIRAEDGLQSIPEKNRPDAFPVLTSVDDLWAQLDALRKENHDYKTVVIDSVTKLETMFTQFVVENDPNKPLSINQAMGGYGAGVAAVGSLHQRVRKLCVALNERLGMHVVFIAHADLETIDLPDVDAYNRYSLRLGKKSMAPYIDDVDLVGFIKLETFAIGKGEKKKAQSDGTRLLVTYSTAANVSKNRYGITKDLPVVFGKNPLIGHVPVLTPPKKEQAQ